MKLDINGIMYAFAFGLDKEEAEFFSIKPGHGKRVALMSILSGEKLGLNQDSLSDLAVLSILHDNALTQYHAEERVSPKVSFGNHCIYGESNIRFFPFRTDITNGILFHHERPDGKGIFLKTDDEIPLYAKLIHFSDYFDLRFNPSTQRVKTSFEDMKKEIDRLKGTELSATVDDVFLDLITPELYDEIYSGQTEQMIDKIIPPQEKEYTFSEVKSIVDVFARIIDLKSRFTTTHSLGLAEKAYKMGKYYDYDELTCEKLYVAGALHDIGKMAIPNNILEKNGKLTPEETEIMHEHALYTYKILSKIKGFDEICLWASSHHEKLDGSGYPLHKTAKNLSKNERLLTCLDIYQALTEDRPYKTSWSKAKVEKIMREMVNKGQIDKNITEEVFTAL